MADTNIDILVDLAIKGGKADDTHLQKVIMEALTGLSVPDPTLDVTPKMRMDPKARQQFANSVKKVRLAMEHAMAGELKNARGTSELKDLSSKTFDSLEKMARHDKQSLAQVHKVFGEVENLLGLAKVGSANLNKKQAELLRSMRAGDLEFNKIASGKDKDAITKYLVQKEREISAFKRARSRLESASKTTFKTPEGRKTLQVPPILVKDLNVELDKQSKQLALDKKLVDVNALERQQEARRQKEAQAALKSAERRRKLTEAIRKTDASIGLAGDPTQLSKGQVRQVGTDLNQRRKAIENYYNSMSRSQRQNTELARTLRTEMERVDNLVAGVKQAPEYIARRDRVQRKLADRAARRTERGSESATISRGFGLFDPRSDGDIERIRQFSAAEMASVEQSIRLQKRRDAAAVERAQRLNEKFGSNLVNVDRLVERQNGLLNAERRMEEFRRHAHSEEQKRAREQEQRARALSVARQATRDSRGEIGQLASGTKGMTDQAIQLTRQRLQEAGRDISSYLTQLRQQHRQDLPVYKALENQLARIRTKTAELNKVVADRGRQAAMRELFMQTKQQTRQGSRIVQDFGGVDNVPKEHLREVAEAYSLNVKRARELRAAQDLNTRAGQRRFRQLTRYINQTSNSIDMLNAKIRGNTSFLEQSNRLIRQFFRYALGYGALYQVLQGFTLLTRAVVGLNKELKSIQAISQATDAEMSTMSATIKQVALNTKFGINEIAQAGRVLAQAGVKPEDFDATLANTAMFAAATETSIATAADLVSTMRNVFGDLADGTITNQLTKAINISKLTGEDLRTILSISAQVSKSYGLTSEQYLAAVTTLRNAGLKASTVATGLRQGLIELFSPDSKTVGVLQQRYKELGENLTQEAIRGRFFDFRQQDNPMAAALRELERLGFSGSGRRTFQRTFDIRAENALRALIDNLHELEGAEQRLTFGTAALDANQKQMESLSNSVDNLGAALTVFADSAVGGAVDGLESLVDAATNGVQALTSLSDEMKVATGTGAGTVALQALLGGATGAALAKGNVLRRLGGAVTGAAVGGVAGSQATQASADAGLSSAASAANGLVASLFAITALKDILSVFGGKGKGSGAAPTLAGQKYLQPEVLKTHVSVVSRAMSKVFEWWTLLSGSVAGLTTAFKTLGPLKGSLKILGTIALRLAPLVGVAVAAATVFSALGGRSNLADAKKKMLAAREAVAKARSQLDTDLTEFDEFTLDAEGVAKKGTTAEGVQKLQTRVSDFRHNMDRRFQEAGQSVIDANYDAIEDELVFMSKYAADQGGQSFKASVQRLNGLLKTDVLELVDAKTLSEIANEAAAIRSQTKSLGEDMRRNMTNIMEFTGTLTASQDALQRVIKRLVLEGGDAEKLLKGELDKLPKAMTDLAMKMISQVASYRAGVERKAVETAREAQTVTLLDAVGKAGSAAQAYDLVLQALPSYEDQGLAGVNNLRKLADRFGARRKELQGSPAIQRFVDRGTATRGEDGIVRLNEGSKGTASIRGAFYQAGGFELQHVAAVEQFLTERADRDFSAIEKANVQFVTDQNKRFADLTATFESKEFQDTLATRDKSDLDNLAKVFKENGRGEVVAGNIRREENGVLRTTAAYSAVDQLLSDFITTTQNKTKSSLTAILESEFEFPVQLTEEITKQKELARGLKTRDPKKLAIPDSADNRLDNPLNRVRDLEHVYYDLLIRHLQSKVSAAEKLGDADAEKKNRKKLNKALADEAKARQKLEEQARQGVHALSKKELEVHQQGLSNKLKALTQEEAATKQHKIGAEKLLEFERRRRQIVLDQIDAEQRKLELDNRLTKEAKENLDLRREEASRSKFGGTGAKALITSELAAIDTYYRKPTTREAIQGSSLLSDQHVDTAVEMGIIQAQMASLRRLRDQANDPTAVHEYTAALDKLAVALDMAARKAASMSTEMGGVAVVASRIAEAFDADALIAKLDRTGVSLHNIGGTVQDQIVDGFGKATDAAIESSGTGKSAWVSFRDTVKSVINDIMKSVVKAYAQQGFRMLLMYFANSGGSNSGPSGTGDGYGSYGDGAVATGGVITNGGAQNSFARGGVVSGPGTGVSDDVPASVIGPDGKRTGGVMLSNGEGILNAGAMKALGSDWLHATNKMHFQGYATGGVVGGVTSANARLGRHKVDFNSKVDLNAVGSGLSPDQIHEMGLLMDQKITTTLEDEQRPGGILNRD